MKRQPTTKSCLFAAYILGFAALDAAASDALMMCQLDSGTSMPGETVLLEVFLQDADDVGAYRTAIQITRTSGTGAVFVDCPGAVVIDEARPDYVFFGEGPTVVLIDCPVSRASAELLGGGVDVGQVPAYLSTYTLSVSEDAAPGSTFEIAVLPAGDSVLADSAGSPIPFDVGPVCTLGVEPFPTLSFWTDLCSQCVREPETVTVTLEVSNLAEAVNGVQALFHYDAAVLSLVAMVPGDGLGSPWDAADVVFFNDDGGDVTGAWVLNGGGSSADAAVATATFSTSGPGVSSVAFRPDDPPHFTKITTAAQSATIFPVRIGSGDFILGETSKGDINGDGLRNGADVQGFVDVLLDPDAAEPARLCAADMNGDGDVDMEIDGSLFITCLLAGDCICP